MTTSPSEWEQFHREICDLNTQISGGLNGFDEDVWRKGLRCSCGLSQLRETERQKVREEVITWARRHSFVQTVEEGSVVNLRQLADFIYLPQQPQKE